MIEQVKALTLMQGAAVALVAVLAALFVFRAGVLNTLAWLVAIAAVGIGFVNKASYGG